MAILHDARPVEEARRAPPSTLRQLAWNWLGERSIDECCQRSELIICPSRYTRDHLLALRGELPVPATAVVPHGIDLDAWQAVRDEGAVAGWRGRCGLDEREPYIIAVGQHIPHKNFSLLVESFARHVLPQHPAAHLLLAGGHNTETGHLRQQISAMGVDGRVHLLGFVADADLRALVRGATVFACPSLFEGFGLPVLEAFAAETAVACSATTSVGEVAADAALTFDPTRADACGDAIARLLADEPLRNQLIARGRAIARSGSWAACADAYADVLMRVARGQRG